MDVALSRRLTDRVKFSWILSPAKDLLFYIGSALSGWFYVGIILYAIRTLENPLSESIAVITLGA
ncbi:hypothetical protein MJD09_16325 [bacterium]|nr:hypothetical protein [bacterium]